MQRSALPGRQTPRLDAPSRTHQHLQTGNVSISGGSIQRTVSIVQPRIGAHSLPGTQICSKHDVDSYLASHAHSMFFLHVEADCADPTQWQQEFDEFQTEMNACRWILHGLLNHYGFTAMNVKGKWCEGVVLEINCLLYYDMLIGLEWQRGASRRKCLVPVRPCQP